MSYGDRWREDALRTAMAAAVPLEIARIGEMDDGQREWLRTQLLPLMREGGLGMSIPAPYFDDGQVSLYLGDCLDVMRQMKSESVDAVVTDPPAAISFMGKSWDGDRGGRDRWIDWLSERLASAARVMKPGAHALVWALPRTAGWTQMALEDAGFEVRDAISHLFGSGFAKSQNVLRPGHEIWWLARKPFKGSAAANVLRHGTGALNVGACRIATGESTSRPRGSFPFSDDAWGDGRPDEVSVTHEGGRWPSNAVFTHSALCVPAGTALIQGNQRVNPTVAAARPVQAAKGAERERHRGPRGHGNGDGTETVRVFRCAPDCPVGELDRQSGITGTGHRPARRSGIGYGSNAKGTDDGEQITFAAGTASRFYPVFRYESKAPQHERPRLADGTVHPTVKPLGLMRWLVRLVTPPGGRVLDLFAGSGATGEACVIEGFPCVLIEQDPSSCELIKVRLAKPIQPVMFGGDL